MEAGDLAVFAELFSAFSLQVLNIVLFAVFCKKRKIKLKHSKNWKDFAKHLKFHTVHK